MRSPATTAAIAALVDADLAAAREARVEHARYVAGLVGLPGITRGDHVTYLDDDAVRHGRFDRVAEYGWRRGSRVTVAYYRVVIITPTGEEAHVDPAVVERAAAPALPPCTGFVGTGRRCRGCRIHKDNHA
jgi:hypothetical protein